MIWNDGYLPENWTTERLLKKHSSKPYNPDIANAFFKSGYVESWGRGTLKIIEKCKEAGLPTPDYYYEPSDFWIEFRKELFTEEYFEQHKLNKRQIEALKYLSKNDKITNKKYQEINQCSRNTASNDLAELVAKGLVKTSGQKGGWCFLYIVKELHNNCITCLEKSYFIIIAKDLQTDYPFLTTCFNRLIM